jgi:hypothetical protein
MEQFGNVYEFVVDDGRVVEFDIPDERFAELKAFVELFGLP